MLMPSLYAMSNSAVRKAPNLYATLFFFTVPRAVAMTWSPCDTLDATHIQTHAGVELSAMPPGWSPGCRT